MGMGGTRTDLPWTPTCPRPEWVILLGPFRAPSLDNRTSADIWHRDPICSHLRAQPLRVRSNFGTFAARFQIPVLTRAEHLPVAAMRELASGNRQRGAPHSTGGCALDQTAGAGRRPRN